MPIAISMVQGRRAASTARFGFPSTVGWTINFLGVLWIAFQLVSDFTLDSLDLKLLSNDLRNDIDPLQHASGNTCYFDDDELGLSGTYNISKSHCLISGKCGHGRTIYASAAVHHAI